MSQRLDLVKVLEWLVMAGLGGMARFVAERLNQEAIGWRKYALLGIGNVFISAFSGLMGALLATTLTTDPVYQFLACGVCGYFGTKGMERIGNYVLSRFKV